MKARLMTSALIVMAAIPALAQESTQGFDPEAMQHIESTLHEIEVMLSAYAALYEVGVQEVQFVGVEPTMGDPSRRDTGGATLPGGSEGLAPTASPMSERLGSQVDPFAIERIRAAEALSNRYGHNFWAWFRAPNPDEAGDAGDQGGLYGWLLGKVSDLRAKLEGSQGVTFAGFDVTVGMPPSATVRFDFVQRPESPPSK